MRQKNQTLYSPILPKIINDSKVFEQCMENNTPQIVPMCEEIGKVSKSEIVKIYTQKLVQQDQPARKYYNQIISLAPNGICPYCRQQIASTLDHFLPKSHYSSLVITPTNLIPSCSNCNKNKSDSIIDSVENAIFNPYYENSDKYIWLKGNLVEDSSSDSLIMTFYVEDANLDPTYRERIKNQFLMLKLNILYSKHAAEELIVISKRHIRLYSDCGLVEVKKDIDESIFDNEHRPNSWQYAMYTALKNEWYYNYWLPKYASNKR